MYLKCKKMIKKLEKTGENCQDAIDKRISAYYNLHDVKKKAKVLDLNEPFHEEKQEIKTKESMMYEERFEASKKKRIDRSDL